MSFLRILVLITIHKRGGLQDHDMEQWRFSTLVECGDEMRMAAGLKEQPCEQPGHGKPRFQPRRYHYER